MDTYLGMGMNNRRKLLVGLGVGALTAPFGSFAQQQSKVWRIGFLGFAGRNSYEPTVYGALSNGMRELGYVAGTNVVVE